MKVCREPVTGLVSLAYTLHRAENMTSGMCSQHALRAVHIGHFSELYETVFVLFRGCSGFNLGDTVILMESVLRGPILSLVIHVLKQEFKQKR